jgi:hypothetical protein
MAMPPVQLKLKQASAVLGIAPKELQNLIQFGVLKPRRRGGLSVFDRNTLRVAMVALYLKRALGTNTRYLCEFASALARYQTSRQSGRSRDLVFRARPGSGRPSIDVKVPVERLADEVDERLRWLELYKDLPRGRKRPGWKQEFLASLREAAKDLGEVSEAEILRTIRAHRKEKSKPEITVVAQTQAASA